MSNSAKIIDGKTIGQNLLEDLAQKIQLIKNTYHKVPKLAIILVGNDYASTIYVNNKIKAAQSIGIDIAKIEIDVDISTIELLTIIQELNLDISISGIIVQLPLPSHIDKNKILFALDPQKDVDGFHPVNVGYLNSNINQGFVPCTALGCLQLIKSCTADLSGKNIAIISRSQIVGRPLTALLLKHDATVTICHSKTQNLQEITRKADIVVSAIGKANFLTTTFFNSNAIVIDVGISRNANNQIAGDVDFVNVKDKVRYISPVPGGVGPMTVTFLLMNTYQAFILHHNIVLFTDGQSH